MKRELRIVCTDKGTHPSRDLGVISWTPEALRRDGFAVWDATEDQSQHEPGAMQSTGRQTRAGRWRPTERAGVDVTTRADGGQTFTFPSCPTCHGEPRILRDDTLGRILRVETSGRVDVSRLP